MRRLLLKAIGYRVLATAITVFVASMITGSVTVGAAVGVVDSLLKLLGYMTYEVLWERTEKRTTT